MRKTPGTKNGVSRRWNTIRKIKLIKRYVGYGVINWPKDSVVGKLHPIIDKDGLLREE